MGLDPSYDNDAVLVEVGDVVDSIAEGGRQIAAAIAIVDRIDRRRLLANGCVWTELIIRVPAETDEIRQVAAAAKVTLGVVVTVWGHTAHDRAWELDIYSRGVRTVVLGPKPEEN